MNLSGKRCIITGASAGIGQAIAKAFATAGAHVIMGARRLDRLQEMEQELRDLGAPVAESLFLDVQSNASVEQFCNHVLKAGAPNILINNAGLAIGVDHLSDGSIEDWQTVLDTNITGTLRMTRTLLPAMKEASSGHIIMIGSIAGHSVYEGGGVYCASKHALKALTKTLKLELNGLGIRVSSVDPGLVETEFSKVRLNDDNKAAQVYAGLTPLTPADIAECVLFMATRQDHVNIDEIVLTPTEQATVYKTHRKK